MSFISDLLINVSAFRITIGNKINALGNRIGTLTALTTSNKSSLVEAVNELNGKSFSISVGAAMGEINQTNGNTIYSNSIAISNKQDSNTHPKNSGGLQAFGYNAPSAVNYPVVAGAGGGGGISFYRNNSAGGLLSSFDIVKAEHSEEKLRFRVGISTTAKGGWKTFASEEYVDNAIAGLGVGEHKSKKFNLIEAYRRTVIPLCPLHNSVNISANYYFFGEVFAKRSNILNSAQAKMTIEVGKYSNSEIPIVNISQTNQAANLFFRPVTFLYNGLRYFGVEIGSNSANYSQAHVDGFASDWNIIEAIDIYNTQNQTILNAEIYNSLQEYTYQNDSYNLRKKHLYKLEAEAFIKRGGTGTNILLDDGNVKPVSDFKNNYVDIIQTTNGTTAGTVYTFKRIGLSDLTLTLTAASATFSGVVTTGTQDFEGVKKFLKSPKVPIAVNSDEAVNKGQVDSAGYIRALTTGGNIIPYDPTNDADNFLTGVFYAAGSNKPAGINSNVLSLSANVDYVFQLGSPFSNESVYVRSKFGSSWTPWRELYHTGNFNPAQYVMISALNTTLAGYATLAGTQTFTGQITYTQAPIVPNGTLNGHTVNLGQLNTILNDYASINYVNQQIQNISLTPGPQGLKGDKGDKGDPGTQGIQGVKGDKGDKGDAGVQGIQGVKGDKGDKGDTGAQGIQGVQGVAGTNGKTWLSGTTAPASGLGVIGDFYLNTATWDVYEKTAAAVWTSRGNIKGATGAQGIQGTQGIQGVPGTNGTNGTNGIDGKTILSGTANPTNALGTVGDYYLNRTTWDMFEKTATTVWTLRGNIKGAQGNQGIQGVQGIPGQQGQQGPQGPAGLSTNRIYDPTDPVNNDYWAKININSVRHDFGFDVCNYEPQTQEYVSIFSNYGAPYLNEGILGSIALMCPHTGVPVIKGTVECQTNLNPYIDNNQIYFCLVYERDTSSPTYLTGSLQMLTIQDIVSHTGSGSVEMFNSIIVLGVATRDNTLMVQHREF